jgi:1-pyrroline-5-carboxylate dehydrogenase
METATVTRSKQAAAASRSSGSPAESGVGNQGEGRFNPPFPVNELELEYAPGSPEREELTAELGAMASQVVEIPLIIGGEEVRTSDVKDVVMPHDHEHVLARFHRAGREEALAAVVAAREAWDEWAGWPWQDRAAVLLRASELLSGPWRPKLTAATMLGQSKTVHQAEIDAACEIIDFWRFNTFYASALYEEQPDSAPGTWNRMDHRPLEGFVLAITPFNFSSIGANLPTAPALMGNTVIWKPATTGVLAAYYTYRLLEEAGLPPGVINFLPGRSSEISSTLVQSSELAGIHFTGSTSVFQLLWRQVAENLENYKSYPRIVGETGGKDFIVAHESADPRALAVGMVRGAFEYQGQKCSAASRAYVPSNLWDEVSGHMQEMLSEIRVGDPTDFRNFMCAVIDRAAFDEIVGFIEHARGSDDMEIVAGGSYSDEVGFFIEPTVVLTTDPKAKLMCEEIFGPVLTAYVYDPAEWKKTLHLVDTTSPYGLTGAVFATERAAIREANAALRHAAGNFYINDKPTGAVVGQQPFGGARASGTNDKAGSILNLVRWISPRSIKETLVPPTDYRYPYMEG